MSGNTSFTKIKFIKEKYAQKFYGLDRIMSDARGIN